jgi:hypothetical protein
MADDTSQISNRSRNSNTVGTKRSRRSQLRAKRAEKTKNPAKTKSPPKAEDLITEDISPAHKKGRTNPQPQNTSPKWYSDDDETECSIQNIEPPSNPQAQSSLARAVHESDRQSLQFQGPQPVAPSIKLRERRRKHKNNIDEDNNSQTSSKMMPPPPSIQRVANVTEQQVYNNTTRNQAQPQQPESPNSIEFYGNGPDDDAVSEISLSAEDLQSVRSELSRASYPQMTRPAPNNQETTGNRGPKSISGNIFHSARATGNPRNSRNPHERNHRGGRVPHRPQPGPQNRPTPAVQHQTPRTTQTTPTTQNVHTRTTANATTSNTPNHSHNSAQATHPITPSTSIQNPYKTPRADTNSEPKTKTA